MTFMNYTNYGLHFIFYLVVIFATNMAAKQFCRLSASCLPTMQLASSIAPGILCIWLVFAGFLIPRQSIPRSMPSLPPSLSPLPLVLTFAKQSGSG